MNKLKASDGRKTFHTRAGGVYVADGEGFFLVVDEDLAEAVEAGLSNYLTRRAAPAAAPAAPAAPAYVASSLDDAGDGPTTNEA